MAPDLFELVLPEEEELDFEDDPLEDPTLEPEEPERDPDDLVPACGVFLGCACLADEPDDEDDDLFELPLDFGFTVPVRLLVPVDCFLTVPPDDELPLLWRSTKVDRPEEEPEVRPDFFW